MHQSKRLFIPLLVLILCLSPDLAMAADTISTTGFHWVKNATDQSYAYLGDIFGQIGQLFDNPGPRYLGDVFQVFNLAVLSLGTLIVMYTVIVSTIHTAQEGEAMGKRFGSVWVPIRAVAGLAVLLPSASGYSLIQIIMTSIILQGVWAADGIYNVILDAAATGGRGQPTVVQAELKTLATNLFQSAVCKDYLNATANNNLINGQTITVYNDPIIPGVVHVGVSGSTTFGSVCGTYTSSAPNATVVGADPANQHYWTDAQSQAILDGMSVVDSGAAQEAAFLIAPAKPSFSYSDVITSAMSHMNSTIANTHSVVLTGGQDFQNMLNQARLDGWLFAGSYYFKLINPPGSSSPGAVFAPPAGGPPAITQSETLLGPAADTIQQQVNNYVTQDTGPSAAGSGSQLNLGTTSSGGVFGFISDGTKKLAFLVINGIVLQDPQPLQSLAKLGSELIIATELTWIAIMIGAGIIFLASCIAAGMQPLCWSVTGMFGALLPIFIFLLAMLWSAGVMMAIYVPLIPYLVFTFTALGWMMLVVETIVAAPIVALGIVTPAQEALGKASHAVMLITNVFLRPSLMLIGFIAAARLIVPACNMLNFGFQGTVMASTDSLGIFGPIALVVIYVGVMTSIINQVFSLIYVIPDHIIRWIGGQAEQSIAGKAMEETKAAAQKGAEASGEVMKQSVSGMISSSEKNKEAKATAGGPPAKGTDAQAPGLQSGTGAQAPGLQGGELPGPGPGPQPPATPPAGGPEGAGINVRGGRGGGGGGGAGGGGTPPA